MERVGDDSVTMSAPWAMGPGRCDNIQSAAIRRGVLSAAYNLGAVVQQRRLRCPPAGAGSWRRLRGADCLGASLIINDAIAGAGDHRRRLLRLFSRPPAGACILSPPPATARVFSAACNLGGRRSSTADCVLAAAGPRGLEAPAEAPIASEPVDHQRAIAWRRIDHQSADCAAAAREAAAAGAGRGAGDYRRAAGGSRSAGSLRDPTGLVILRPEALRPEY